MTTLPSPTAMTAPIPLPAIRPGAFPPSPPNSQPGTSHSSMSSNVNRPPYTGPPQNGAPMPMPRKYSTPPTAHMDEQLQIHHRVLRDFLATSAQEEPGALPHSRARDKLLRLSPTQFQELSTDVYDELLRRQDERRQAGPARTVPTSLLPRDNFHPKRNQARQKLSTLAPKKFRELATDVLYELERRHPHFVNGIPNTSRSRSGSTSAGPFPGRRRGSSVSRFNGTPPVATTQLPGFVQGLRRPSVTSPDTPYSPTFSESVRSGAGSISSANEYGRPLPKNFQSNTIVPNKATVVEDDGEQSRYDGSEYNFEGGKRASSRRTTQSSPYGENNFPTTDYQSQVAQLELRVLELENQLRQKDEEISKHQTLHKDVQVALETEQAKSSTLKTDLEKQLDSATTLNSSLQAEVDSLRAANTRLQETARNESENMGSDEWKSRYEELEQSYSTQQQLTDRVRAEAAQALQEMRLLVSRSSDAADREETLHQQISDLQSAVEASKARYAKTKAQLRNLRAISTGILYANQPTAGHYAKDVALRDPAGLVTDVAVTNYQIAVDEVLKLSREEQPRAVLEYMRTLVGSVRGVTTEIDMSLSRASSVTAGTLDESHKRRILKLKARVSAAANNLITAARNYAVGNGLSPVSLVDVSVSNLTAAVVELVKMARVRQAGSMDMGAAGRGAEDSGVEEGSGIDGRAIGLGMSMDGSQMDVSPMASSMMSHHINHSIVSGSQHSVSDPRYILSQSHGHGHDLDEDHESGASGVGALLSQSTYSPEKQLPRSQYQHSLQHSQQSMYAQQQQEQHAGIGMALGHGAVGMNGLNGLGMGGVSFEPGSPGPEFGPTFEALDGHADGSPFA